MTVRRPGRWLLIGASYLAVSLAAAKEARAESFRVNLEYDAAPGCPNQAAFKRIVKSELGYDPFDDAADDHVLVRITRRSEAVEGRIEWRGPTGKWEGEQAIPLTAADCAQVVRAAGFALTVQIQFLARSGGASPGPNPAATPPSSPGRGPSAAGALAEGSGASTRSVGRESTRAESATSADTPDEGAPARPGTSLATPSATAQDSAVARPRARPAPAVAATASAQGTTPTAAPSHRPVFAMGAGPAVGLGLAAGPVFVGRLFGSVEWTHVALELAAGASLPSTTRRADGAGFEQWRLIASAATCAIVGRWHACVLANVGELMLAGTDIDRPTSAHVPILEAGARVAVLQRLGRQLFLSAHADGLVILNQWTARLDGVPVWTTSRLGGQIGVDAGWRFR